MSEYDNTNTFVLFVNDKQGVDARPDRTGTLNVDGVEFFLDGWIKQGKNGPFLSGKIKPKKSAGQKPAKAQTPEGDTDSIPF